MMSWTVLAEPDRIVRPYEDGLGAGDRGQPHGGLHVIAEDEERAAEGNHAAVHGHAVHRRAHAVLADAEVDLAAAGLGGGLHALLQHRAGVARQVGAASDEPRDD